MHMHFNNIHVQTRLYTQKEIKKRLHTQGYAEIKKYTAKRMQYKKKEKRNAQTYICTERRLAAAEIAMTMT